MQNNIPVRTLKRLSFYLSYLEDINSNGVLYISTPKMSQDLNYNEVSIKKDLSYITKQKGKPKVGHKVSDLIADLKEILGYNIFKCACIVGCGNLGKALLKFNGFKKYGFKIVAAFDNNPDLIGTIINEVSVNDISYLKQIVRDLEIPIGIITTNENNAQEVCDKLIDSGIKAIWNFAPVQLKTTKDVVIQNENMASNLAILSNKIFVR